MLRMLYAVLVLVCIAPTLPGVLGVIAAAFSYVPPLNLYQFNLDGFAGVLRWNGLSHSVALTLSTTLLSSYLALLSSFIIIASLWHSRMWKAVERSLSPLLAVPHVAFAIGLAFLLAPTGLLARLSQGVIDAELYRWLVKDPAGLGLTLMLTLKEIPFLLLMSIPVLKQLRVDESYQAVSSLGYSQAAFWWKCVLPQWLPRMRFPLIAVIAYSASVVDVSLIIGPTNPPTFAVLVWQWFSEADLSLYPRASAGALLLFILCSGIILLTRVMEWLLLTHLHSWQSSGRRSPGLPGKPLFAILALLFSATFVVTVIWSLAQRWRFPDLLPSAVTLRFWDSEWASIVTVINQSMILALISATIALFFALLAHEYRLHYRLALPRYLIAIPMLVPQLSLLFGMQVGTLYLDADNYTLWVTWSHVFFAFPYVYLALDGPWSSYNQSYYLTALSLGKSPLRAWFAVKLPMLATAILFAWAVGASVSLAQYLPTLMLGGGRIATLTTEAVALASGFDRRVTAIYAIWQTLLPLALFALTMAANRYINHALRTGGNKKKQGISITHEPLSKEPRHP